jgi:hypothetical protein
VAGTDKAVDFTIKAAAAGGGKAWALIRQGAGSDAVRMAVTNAGERAAKNAADGATKRGGTYLARCRDDRKHRRPAMDLARQIGFPTLPKAAGRLSGRPELSGFLGRRVAPTTN